ncbi:nucleotidyl transferase AbiEii/AbiGii toxin family protein [Pseudoflavitalea sp. G-6-1-2]|uniref:nucleotidyl transferase AbiEii/AbiGii toxin family protein n=1 Tax=Pseudoflavitalea sp. G-6-1-2 TaxID=2728841 RepID=UPI00146AB060|nr:nucleotidyl transferase AbiEii/AbiGii toxin family protein [Pseudoflavitalea sp. G-6-1-2]NML23688.1 nucleotidyl transferase AbiEii/AbiGii toxin family protein [Pseudoflavitalea sp. G-6-1-2]
MRIGFKAIFHPGFSQIFSLNSLILEAVSKDLQSLIIEIQSLPAFANFALAGGTNLALLYNHRVSEDIDLISSEIVGISGMKQMEESLKAHFKDAVMYCEVINTDLGDQFCFLRAFIKTTDEVVKVEVLQNMKTIQPFEEFQNIRLVSKLDIGLFKLMSASNRKANKDIYDLDFITDEINLDYLLNALEEKRTRYNLPEHRCLFDLDHETNPIENLGALLEFDNIDYNVLPLRPSHSNDRISIMSSLKDWRTARSSWKRKVREIMRIRGIEPPPIKPVN